MKNITRREILKYSLNTSALSMLGLPLKSHAFELEHLTDEPHFFVSVFFEGGWDITLGLDPWTKETLPSSTDMFIEYRAADVQTHSGIPLAPAAHSLGKFANRMSVVNGIFLSTSDNGHDASLNYMLNGRSSQTANITVELANALNQSDTNAPEILSNSTRLSTAMRSATKSNMKAIYKAYEEKSSGPEISALLKLLKIRF